jgi:hypothetical protein
LAFSAFLMFSANAENAFRVKRKPPLLRFQRGLSLKQ